MLSGKDHMSKWVTEHFESMSSGTLANLVGLGADKAVDRVLGEQQADSIRTLLQQPPGDTQSTATVFMPGIMGSLLTSVRGSVGLMWLNMSVIMNGKINLLELNADGTEDLSPDVEIVPNGVEKTYYLKAILTLARNTRLFEFPYDWRRRLEYNAGVLRQSILKWSREAPGRKFNLVGHSMGGMLARTYLALYPAEAEQYVERVVLLGSPVYGAPLVAHGLVGDEARIEMMDRIHEDNKIRRLVRNLPATYQLLPPPPEILPSGIPYPFNWDPYDARAWGINLRQDYLDGARRWYQLVLDSDPQCDIWQIAGCHRPTVTRVLQEGGEGIEPGAPVFRGVTQESGIESGDQQVPLWSARGPNIKMLYVVEAHRNLPVNTAVLRDVLQLIDGKEPYLPSQLPEPPRARVPTWATQWGYEARALRKRYDDGTLTAEDIRQMFFMG